ncbi:MOSC domain-containing protein [Actinokineospora inagensis]|uniref:MOSC domain-containing protein n=1 Tax=Actinokineospora inagensis TaxID=103730 RepID=UPI000425D3F0|nr:MOSC domain-containing protein [Actinokineospora inagensis]
MSPPVVAELWRYPVKSMGGERLTELVLDRGVVGDRAFAVVAVATGRVLTAKRVPDLLDATARWLGAAAEITLPGGPTVRTDDPDVDAVISRWLGQPVRLERPAGHAVAVEEYQRDLDRPADMTSFDLPTWGFVDEGPVHLLSRDSLDLGRQWYPDGDWDLRRFRPNIVLTSAAHPGEGAAGDELRIGQAVVEVTGPCIRCVMVTQPQRDLPKDRAVLRSLISRSAAKFGTYAAVRHPGAVHCGDPVTALVPGQADGVTTKERTH